METHLSAKDDELLVQSTAIEPHPQVAEVLSRATAKPLTNKARTHYKSTSQPPCH